MHQIGARDIGYVLLSVTMVAVGLLGIIGRLTAGPVLVGGLLVALVVVSFDLGRRSADLW